MTGMEDDLGQPVERDGMARRVVSLVPSLTESVALTRPMALAGATAWCTHPAGLDVPRVRGTKNPDVAAIVALEPDIVLANQEENRRVDVERLRAAGIPVWVTVIRERYPHVSLEDIAARAPEIVVLPDEPYRFAPYDGPEAFPGQRVALIEGRTLTWYGPSLVAARAQLTAELAR